MKILFGIPLFLAFTTSAFAADWQCFSVSYHQGNSVTVAFTDTIRLQVIPANEKVDDFLQSLSTDQICLKGRPVTETATFLAYDAK